MKSMAHASTFYLPMTKLLFVDGSGISRNEDGREAQESQLVATDDREISVKIGEREGRGEICRLVFCNTFTRLMTVNFIMSLGIYFVLKNSLLAHRFLIFVHVSSFIFYLLYFITYFEHCDRHIPRCH